MGIKDQLVNQGVMVILEKKEVQVNKDLQED